ncbi:hypothetical protein [Phormidium sp. CCY1219]|uniref:hypothetical protein n=1 Tax=Phormidium sp. CCY1219 TaxID=2886104 RepID=UPI002D1E909F|nr:hypothetical protein [Phormidium sp. CCY1219]MEB3828138.1 hypothetical protein [Phormidium sp. CCY1219]
MYSLAVTTGGGIPLPRSRRSDREVDSLFITYWRNKFYPKNLAPADLTAGANQEHGLNEGFTGFALHAGAIALPSST